MSTPKLPLITPERLQRLSGKQFRAIQELVEAEEVRRLAPRLTLSRPIDELTATEARMEMAKLSVAENAWRRRLDTIYRLQGEAWKRRREIENVVLRAHLEPLIGAFVTIRDPGKAAEPLQPKEGNIGRLRKVGPTGALIDFGDELRTWYIPLWAVGEVKDPFADDRRD
jgi:hypothetical protein